MNIAIDTTFFGHEEIENKSLTLSTSIFTADLLDAFARLNLAENFTLIANYNHEEFLRQRFPQYKIKPIKNILISFLNKLSKGRFKGIKLLKKWGIYRRTIKKGKFDFIWFPFGGDNNYFVKTGLKGVVTLHDLYGFHSGSSSLDSYKDVIDKKNTIVTISEYTKSEILRFLNYKNKINVIPNSITFDISKTESVIELKDKKFILDINSYIDKKNPITLLKAFNLIKNKIDEMLIFCGGYKDELVYSQMINFVKDNNLNNRVLFFYKIPEGKRNWLLKNTVLFVTPSQFEGFGRTPVEAAVCNVPVISTKETSLYEATMGLVNYVENSSDENELADLIIKVLNEKTDENKLCKISETLRNNYSAKACAEKYWDIFLSIR